MKPRTSLVFLAILTTALPAYGDKSKPRLKGLKVPASSDGDDGLALSGSKLANNPPLQKEIDQTLITTNSCRSMAAIGFANGYQCPMGAAVSACMKMMKDGKVDVCAELTGRNYGSECKASKEKNSAEERARSKCLDLSDDLWASLAIKVPFNIAKKQLEAFGCKIETGTTVFCKGRIREWICKPLERGGVVTCRPPKKVRECDGPDPSIARCHEVDG